MKVVIDTNVLIAIVPDKSKYHFVNEQQKTNNSNVVMSSQILHKYEEQQKLRRKFA